MRLRTGAASREQAISAQIFGGTDVLVELELWKARAFQVPADYFQDIGEAEQLGNRKSRLLETTARLSHAAEKLAGGTADRPTG